MRHLIIGTNIMVVMSIQIKIIKAIDTLAQELMENPYFLAKYDEKLNLYRRTILKGRFLIYYEIKEKEAIIEIQYFRSSYQNHCKTNYLT